MPVFTYKAFQSDGKTAEGQIEAGGRQEAFRQMEEKGKPVQSRLAEKVQRPPSEKRQRRRSSAGFKFSFHLLKPRRRTLENFTRLLSSLLGVAGAPP